MKGKMVILSGPSGVGKDTLLDRWIEANPLVRRVVTYTTRPPREGERDGIDYHFVTERRFQELVREGAFWEHKNVHGNLYASPKKDTEQMVAEGLIAVLKIDVQGALSVMPLCPEAVSVFIMPPSMEELERRIVGRGTESDESLNLRLQNAKWEISQSNHYRHRVVNDDVSRAVAELEQIIKKQP